MPDLTAGMARRMRCAMAVRRMTVRQMTVANLAAWLEVSRPTVSRWASGRQALSAEWAARVAAALRVPVGWLVNGEPLDTQCEYLLSRLRGEMVMMAPAQREAVLMTVMDDVTARAMVMEGAMVMQYR